MLIRPIQMMLYDATGLNPSAATISKAVRARMRELNIVDSNQYAQDVKEGSRELAALIDHVVVPETWFFRDAEAFKAACRVVQEKRDTGTFPVRILCLPCATGEEPYSLAMALLDQAVAPANFVIHGADISTAALQRARNAVYLRNAFRTEDLRFRQRHFAETEDGYALLPHVRELVRFEHANLLALAPRQQSECYDIIFCRNLLIYFDEATQQAAIARLQGLLRKDGLLFTGYAETPAFCRHGFTLAPFPRAFALVRQEPPPPLPPLMGARLRLAHNTPRRTAEATVASRRPITASVPAAAGIELSHGVAPKLLQQARHLADIGKFDDAIRACRHYLKLAPDSAEAHFLLGLLNERMQDLPSAEDCLRRAVYLDPEHYEALCHLALLKEQRGEPVPAAALRQRAARVFGRRGST